MIKRVSAHMKKGRELVERKVFTFDSFIEWCAKQYGAEKALLIKKTLEDGETYKMPKNKQGFHLLIKPLYDSPEIN